MILSVLPFLAAAVQTAPPPTRAVARVEARILAGRIVDFREARARRVQRRSPQDGERRLVEFE